MANSLLKMLYSNNGCPVFLAISKTARLHCRNGLVKKRDDGIRILYNLKSAAGEQFGGGAGTEHFARKPGVLA